MRKIVLAFIIVAGFSCKQTNELAEEPGARISLSVHNLPRLEGAHYQLWATFFSFNKINEGDTPTHEGEYVFLGDFVVSDGGTVQSLSGGDPRFALPAGSNAQLLRDIVISVKLSQASRTTDAQPVSIVIGGAFQGSERVATAELTMAYADAFKTDFSTSTGFCTITAPTSPADSNSGIWFADLRSTPSPGLRNLPALPSQWRYEGWVMDGRVPSAPVFYSTGKFLKADTADFDGAGSGGGSGTPLNFPGQDFVTGSFRPDLTDPLYAFMVTIEPHPDNSSGPFFLRLFSSSRLNVPPVLSRSFALSNVLPNYAPTGHVTVER